MYTDALNMKERVKFVNSIVSPVSTAVVYTRAKGKKDGKY